MRYLLKILIFSLCLIAVTSADVTCPSEAGGPDKYLSNDGQKCLSSCEEIYKINKAQNRCVLNCENGEYSQYQQNALICFSCENGLFANVDNTKCQDSCNPGEAANDSLKQCQKCTGTETGTVSQDGKSCVTYCINAISQTDVAENKKCTACTQPNSIISSDKTTCVKECKEGETLLSQNDIQKCSKCDEYHFSSVDNSKCVQGCNVGESANQQLRQCQACTSHQYVSVDNSQCVDLCNPGEAANDQLKKCQKCTGTDTANVSQDGKSCVLSCENSVSIADSNGNKKCTACSKPSFIISSDGKSCVEKCNTGEALQNQNNIQKCLKCDTFVSSDNSQCVQSCNPGEAVDDKLKKCEKCTGTQTDTVSQDGKSCVSQCSNAISTTDSSGNKKCSICSGTNSIINSEGNVCVGECLQGEIIVKQNDIQKCQKCEPTQFVSTDNSKCLMSCNPGEAANDYLKKCQKCTGTDKDSVSQDGKSCVQQCSNAITITDAAGNKKCTGCTQPSIIISSDGKRCVEKCNTGEALQNQNNVQKCLKCDTLVSSDNSQCVQSCNPGEAVDDLLKKCQKCTGTLTDTVSLDGKNCVESCRFGIPQKDANGNKKCIVCTQPEGIISSAGITCVGQCQQGETLLKQNDIQKCSKCEQSLFSSVDGSQCVKSCNAGESANQSLRQCQKCTSLQYVSVDNLQCVDLCNPGEAANDSLKKCQKCTGTDTVNVSQDGKRCVLSCENSVSIPDSTGNKKCTICTGINNKISSNGQACVSKCGSFEAAISQNNILKCTACPQGTFISSNGASCVDSCNQMEVGVTATKKCTVCILNTETKKCEVCPTDKPFLSIDGQSCVMKCEVAVDLTLKQCLASKDSCSTAIQVDNFSCNSGCLEGQASTTPSAAVKYIQCELCSQNEKNKILSSDSTSCLAVCPDGQITIKKGTYQQCQLCSDSTPFISSDASSCVQSCGKGQLIDKSTSHPKCYNCPRDRPILNQSGDSCVEICPKGFATKSYDNYKQCFACQNYISADGANCLDSCSVILNPITNQCLNNLSDCQGVVVTDAKTQNKTCKEACESSQAKKKQQGYYECLTCSSLLTNLLSSAADDCLSVCPDNEVMVNKEKCVSQLNAQRECDKKKMSSDKKSCFETCVYPDFSDTDNTCKSIKNCSGDAKCCSNYTAETVLDMNIREISCSNQSSCKSDKSSANQKYISTSKKCVTSCKQIGEIADPATSTCKSCSDSETLFIENKESQGKCIPKQSLNIDQKTSTIDQQITTKLESEQAAENIKSQLSTAAKESKASFTTDDNTTNTKDKLNKLLALALKFIESISNLASADKPQSFGDTEKTIKTIGQKVKPGFRLKKINVNSLLNNDNESIVEPDSLSKDSMIASFQVNKSNPFCSRVACQSMPFIQAQKTPSSALRLLDTSSPFNAEFTVDSPNPRYACVSYDDPNAPTGVKPISSSGNTYTCAFSTNVQLQLDSQCKYLKSDCPVEESDESPSGLSLGGIVGIALGSFTVVAFAIIGVYYYIKKRRLQSTMNKDLELQNVKDLSSNSSRNQVVQLLGQKS